MKTLLNPCYFGSISYWLGIWSSDELLFEIWDNYQKQTQRNRCVILAANGPLSLSIPVNYTQKNRQLYKEVLIANDSSWQDQHLKSLSSAYLMSPFYEYYIDALRPLYEKTWKFLIDFNLESLQIISNSINDSALQYKTTDSFLSDPERMIDLRHLSHKNASSPFDLKAYSQVFSEKFGFTRDLCILDLLFNEGPNTENLLMKQLI